MSAPSSIPIESLLVHSDWVRGLVARLVYDPSLADDVLQETWRLSLERPPREAVDLRGWLGQVARNAHRHLLRREGRLKGREEGVDRGEGLPDTVEVIAKVDLQRRMAEAVLGLDEPYRSCVLMRYFEGLPPREIAARLGLPVPLPAGDYEGARTPAGQPEGRGTTGWTTEERPGLHRVPEALKEVQARARTQPASMPQ